MSPQPRAATASNGGADFTSPHRLEYLEPLAPRLSATGLARLVSALVSVSLLAAALILGVTLRTVALERVPAGFNQDEACNGYDAYSLMRTGRDQHGNFLPIAIQAFNDYRMPLFDYSLIAPIAMFGLRPAAVRLGAAMWGIADLIAVAVVACLLVGLRGAALTVALLAISPWHLPVSRFGHEAITASAAISLAAAAFFLAIRLRRGSWLLVCGLMLGLSLYSYSITKAFVLPFLIWTAAIYWSELRGLRSHALAGLIIMAVCALPQAWALWHHYPQMMARYYTVSVLRLPWPGRLREFWHGLIFDFSPRFLFFKGSRELTSHPPGYGQLLAAQGGMLFLAFAALVDRRFRRAAIFLFGWLAIAALTAALILPYGHSLHALLMLTPLTLLSALGMVFLFDLASASRLARLVVAVAILLLMAIQGAKFVNFYFRDYPALAAYQFQYGLGNAVTYAARLGPRPVVISDTANQPYIYVLFFTRYPPERFHNGNVVQDKGLFAPVQSFDGYRFDDPQMAYLKMAHGVFVFTALDPAPARPVYTVHFPAGQIAYQVVVK